MFDDTMPASGDGRGRKVAFLVPHYVGGGAERVCLTLGTSLRDRFGHEVEIWSTRFAPGQRERVERESGLRTASPRDLRPGVRHVSRHMAPLLGRMVRKRGIDALVLTVSPPGGLEELRALLPAGVRLIFHLHGQPWWELTPFRTPFIPRGLWSRIRRIGWWMKRGLKERFFHTYTRRVERRYDTLMRVCDAYVTLCPEYAAILSGRAASINPNLLLTSICNPFDAGRFQPWEQAPKERVVTFVGRLTHDDKRVDRLLEAWAMIAPDFPSWRLEIVGDGPERKSLEAQARAIAADIRFEGYRKPEPYLARASVLAMTSQFEGWPLSLMEGLAAGCRVIAFDCSAGVRGVLSEGRGTLVPLTGEAPVRAYESNNFAPTSAYTDASPQVRAYADALAELMRQSEATVGQPRRPTPAIAAWLSTFAPDAIAQTWHRLLSR